ENRAGRPRVGKHAQADEKQGELYGRDGAVEPGAALQPQPVARRQAPERVLLERAPDREGQSREDRKDVVRQPRRGEREESQRSQGPSGQKGPRHAAARAPPRYRARRPRQKQRPGREAEEDREAVVRKPRRDPSPVPLHGPQGSAEHVPAETLRKE